MNRNTEKYQKYKTYLTSDTWKLKRKTVFAARGRKCERCPSTKVLQIHHKNYDSLYNERLEDLEILCLVCHKKEHKKKPKPKRVNTKIKKINKMRKQGYSKADIKTVLRTKSHKLIN